MPCDSSILIGSPMPALVDYSETHAEREEARALTSGTAEERMAEAMKMWGDRHSGVSRPATRVALAANRYHCREERTRSVKVGANLSIAKESLGASALRLPTKQYDDRDIVRSPVSVISWPTCSQEQISTTKPTNLLDFWALDDPSVPLVDKRAWFHELCGEVASRPPLCQHECGELCVSMSADTHLLRSSMKAATEMRMHSIDCSKARMRRRETERHLRVVDPSQANQSTSLAFQALSPPHPSPLSTATESCKRPSALDCWVAITLTLLGCA
eukprot:CAMPEP_0183335682 /NCGR_PEP_ID=MMETSP0164_2-20130417/3906_1 /TAXON_ID=221442 /ORGANISM="Coccolithus pelagicus ssp braarudi, Strain PLY182g" /LENGTH=272 /DNA_ID=CAMNT_0025505085 /DNA_START=31 /DNA_END=849 /DNA_ORIENTATION=-